MQGGGGHQTKRIYTSKHIRCDHNSAWSIVIRYDTITISDKCTNHLNLTKLRHSCNEYYANVNHTKG